MHLNHGSKLPSHVFFRSQLPFSLSLHPSSKRRQSKGERTVKQVAVCNPLILSNWKGIFKIQLALGTLQVFLNPIPRFLFPFHKRKSLLQCVLQGKEILKCIIVVVIAKIPLPAHLSNYKQTKITPFLKINLPQLNYIQYLMNKLKEARFGGKRFTPSDSMEKNDK